MLIVDRAVRLLQDFGPGLWEMVYEMTLAAKSGKRALSVERQVPISNAGEGQRFDEGFRADLIGEALMRDGIPRIVYGAL